MQEIIEHINKAIVQAIESKPKRQIQTYGLVESVSAKDPEDQEHVLPAIVLPNGECYNVYGLADLKDLTLYHRLQSVSYTERASYGSRKSYESVADVVLVAFGKRKAFNQFVVTDEINNALRSLKETTLVGADYNALQIFANEFQGLSFFLKPDFFLFKINYRITSTLDGCNKN